jgi:hypothetical protein
MEMSKASQEMDLSNPLVAMALEKARIPLTNRGLGWEDYRRANPHARVPLERAEAFCEEFPQRYIPPKTLLADYPEDQATSDAGPVLGGPPGPVRRCC